MKSRFAVHPRSIAKPGERWQVFDVFPVEDRAQVDAQAGVQRRVDPRDNPVECGLAALQGPAPVVGLPHAVEGDLHFPGGGVSQQFDIVGEGIPVGDDGRREARASRGGQEMLHGSARLPSGQERFTAEERHVGLAPGEACSRVAEECIDHRGVERLRLRRVAFLVAVRAGEVARVPGHEEELDFGRVPALQEIQAGLAVQPGLLLGLKEIAGGHRSRPGPLIRSAWRVSRLRMNPVPDPRSFPLMLCFDNCMRAPW